MSTRILVGPANSPVPSIMPAFRDTRAKLAAVVKARDALQESIGIVRHVARTGHAVGEIERAIDIAESAGGCPTARASGTGRARR